MNQNTHFWWNILIISKFLKSSNRILVSQIYAISANLKLTNSSLNKSNVFIHPILQTFVQIKGILGHEEMLIDI